MENTKPRVVVEPTTSYFRAGALTISLSGLPDATTLFTPTLHEMFVQITKLVPLESFEWFVSIRRLMCKITYIYI